MSFFTVVPMRAKHLDAVGAIEERSFSIPWSKKDIAKDFNENNHALYFVALCDNAEETVAGFAGLWHVVNEGHINNFAVDEVFRRQGVGSLLMDKLIEWAIIKEMIGLTLEVRVGNRAAMGLYHKYGFKAEGYRKNYYADNKEDAVIMWLYL